MKYRLVLFFMLIGCFSSSYAQRVCDLEGHLLLPDSGTILESPGPNEINIMVVNLGPDILKTGDYVTHGLRVGGASEVLQFYQLTEGVKVNDTIFLSQSVRSSARSDFKNIQACLDRCYAYTPSSIDTVAIEREGEPGYANNTDCSIVDLIYRLSSINKDEQSQKNAVYPNPTSREISFVKSTLGSDFVITNMLGQSVISGSISKTNSINVVGLESGIYVVNLMGKDGIISQSRFKKN